MEITLVDQAGANVGPLKSRDRLKKVQSQRGEARLFNRLAQMSPSDHIENLKRMGSDAQLKTEIANGRHKSVSSRREQYPIAGFDAWNEKRGNFMEIHKERELLKV